MVAGERELNAVLEELVRATQANGRKLDSATRKLDAIVEAVPGLQALLHDEQALAQRVTRTRRTVDQAEGLRLALKGRQRAG